MTHDELKAKVDRLHRLMSDPSEGSITYQVSVGDLVQDICDAWGRPDPANVAREALEAARQIVIDERDKDFPDLRTARDEIGFILGSPESIAAIIEAARKAP